MGPQVPRLQRPVDAVVLASHLPGEGHFRSKRHKVIGWPCVDEFDYWAGYASVWESDLTIIGLEHDVEVTDDTIAALLACPRPLCSQMYPCHWISTGRFDDVWPGRNEQPGSGGLAVFVETDTEFAAQSAIGCVKITPEARIGPLEQAHWSRLEVSVEKAVQGPWHLHWPGVPHHHW